MKNNLIAIIVSAIVFGIAASGHAHAQNVPFDASGGGKTIYGPWKKVQHGFISITCYRTVYYKSGNTKKQSKWIPFGTKC